MTPCRIEPAAVSRIASYVPTYEERKIEWFQISEDSWKSFQKGI